MLAFIILCPLIISVFSFETPTGPPLPDGSNCDSDSHCSGGRCEFTYVVNRTNWRGFSFVGKCCSSLPSEAKGNGEISCCGNNMTCKEPPASEPNKYKGKCLCVHKPGSMKEGGVCKNYEECSYHECTRKRGGGAFACCSAFEGRPCDDSLGVTCCYHLTCNATNQCDPRARGAGSADGESCDPRVPDVSCASGKCQLFNVAPTEYPLRCCTEEHVGGWCDDSKGIKCCGTYSSCVNNKCFSKSGAYPGADCDNEHVYCDAGLTCYHHYVRQVEKIKVKESNGYEWEADIMNNTGWAQTCCKGGIGDPCPENTIPEWPYPGRAYGCCEGYTCYMGKCSDPQHIGAVCDGPDNCISFRCEKGRCVRDLVAALAGHPNDDTFPKSEPNRPHVFRIDDDHTNTTFPFG